MKNPIKLISALALAALTTIHTGRAASHTWSGAVNNAWSQAGNWSAGGAPQFGEANITLIFPPGAVRYAATNGVGNYAIDAIIISGDNYAIGGYDITLTGIAYYNLNCSGTNNVIGMGMTLSSSLEYFNVDTYGSLTVSGTMTGPGGFLKFGRGKLTLSGSGNNSYVSPTSVREGWLDLAKPPFTTAIPSTLNIGDTDQNTFPVEVSTENNYQIDPNVDVTVNPNCDFYLKGHFEAVHNLRLSKSSVITDNISPVIAGQLTIFGGVSVTNSTSISSSIAGHLSLSGATRTFDIPDLNGLIINAQINDGGQKASILKTGLGTLTLGGANIFTGDTTVSAGIVEVKNALSLGSGGNVYVQDGGSLSLGAVTVANQHLYLNGAGVPPGLGQSPRGAVYPASMNSVWTGPVTLQSDTLICAMTNRMLTLSGVIDGSGGLSTLDWGTVQFAGTSPNTYSGGTYANGGILSLAKSASVAAIPGFLTIGPMVDPTNTDLFAPSNVVQLASSQQIPDNAPIVLNPSAYIDLNGYNESVGALTMIGGLIDANGGVLTLKSNVTGSCIWNNDPTINGNLSLGGATRTFTTLNPGAIFVTGVVSDGGSPAGIIKMGKIGGLRLDGTNNTYTGVTTINEGWLEAEQPGSLGSPVGGTVVGSGGELVIGLSFHGPVETLTLNGGGTFYAVGNNSWDGNVVLNGNANIRVDVFGLGETLDINGVISGTGNLTLEYGGTLRFGGSSPNTYNGRTIVLGNTNYVPVTVLELNKPAGVTAIPGPLVIGCATNPPNHETVRLFAPNQIADTSAVTVNASGSLDLNNQYDTIGSLQGCGNVNLILGALTAGGDNSDTTFSGVIYGVGFVPLTKEGTGSMTLTGTNTCSGKMIVNNGHLYVNGAQTCGVQLNPNGHLHGQGIVGVITGQGGFAIPGDNVNAPCHGQLQSASLNMDSTSDFNVDLGGTAASGNYNRLKVAGTVNLANATLHLTQSAMAKTNDHFVIIDNDGADPVTGTFNGLPENSIITLSPSQVFTISYTNGDGNDVVLTQITAPSAPTIGGITLDNGQTKLTGSGTAGFIYGIDANTNLSTTNWVNIGSATADQNGVINFTDVNAANFPNRFYRFVAP